MRRIFSWILASVVVLLLVGFGLRAEENCRAERDLARYHSQLKTLGERLDPTDFIPPSVPDAENFAMAPLLAPLFSKTPTNAADKAATDRLKKVDLNPLHNAKPAPTTGSYETAKPIDLIQWHRYLQDDPASMGNDAQATARAVLENLNRFAPELEEFAAAANRSYARFSIDYTKGFAISFPHISTLMHFARVYCLRGSASLAAGDIVQAWKDLRTLDRIQSAMQTEPLLISHLVRLTIIHQEQQVIWYGLTQNRWSKDQLREIQTMEARINLFRDYERVARGERAFGADMYQKFAKASRHSQPGMEQFLKWVEKPNRPLLLAAEMLPAKAVMLRNELWNERWLQNQVLPVVDTQAHQIHLEKQKNAEQLLEQSKANPYNFLAKVTISVYSGILLRTAFTQASIDEARVACAVDNFRADRGALPSGLESLVPTYLSSIPHDVVDGSALHYRSEASDQYRIYSVGWNAVDDGGVIVTKSGSPNRRDDLQGDWVWFGGARR